METTPALTQNDVLTLTVSLAQIVGLIVVMLMEGPGAAVITGIAGFAAVVNYFLPSRIIGAWFVKLKTIAALCGVGLIILSIVSVS